MPSGIPAINLTYSLADVANGIASMFNSTWLIVAFAAAIPLAFMIAHKIKYLFVS